MSGQPAKPKDQPTQPETPPEPLFEVVVPPKGMHGIMVFYGQPKIGKSTLAASLTEVSIDTENGLNHIAGVKRRRVSSLKELRIAGEQLQAAGIKRVAIDTIDYVHSWLAKFVCAQAQVKTLSEIPYGGGWQQVEEHLMNIIADWRGRFDLVILVAHQRQATFGEQISAARLIDLPGKLSRKLGAEVDQLGFCEIERTDDGTHRRFINFKPYDGCDSGGRLAALKDQRVEFFEDRERNAQIFDELFNEEETDAP